MISRQSAVHDDVFPSEFHHTPEQRKSCPAVVPLTSNQIEMQWETLYGDHCIRPFQETFNNRRNDFIKPYAMRRHSWSHSIYNIGQKSSNSSSGRSSLASILDAIEECSSEDESNFDTPCLDYMNCITCSRRTSASSVDVNSSEQNASKNTPKMKFCYRCKHLTSKSFLSSSPVFVAPLQSVYWMKDEKNLKNSRIPGRPNLRENKDLPVISEPSFEEEKMFEYLKFKLC